MNIVGLEAVIQTGSGATTLRVHAGVTIPETVTRLVPMVQDQK